MAGFRNWKDRMKLEWQNMVEVRGTSPYILVIEVVSLTLADKTTNSKGGGKSHVGVTNVSSLNILKLTARCRKTRYRSHGGVWEWSI